MAPPSRPCLSRHESMQKYMLLSAQKEALQRRMAMDIPAEKPMTAQSPELQSLSSSPTWSPKYTSPYPPPTDPIPTGPKTGSMMRTSIDVAHTDESQRLSELNHQIVATLTELMNTESVRSDEKNRAWIQEKLMEAEHQIRRERRRHSSIAERDVASAIAHQLELGLHHSRTWA